MIACPNCAARFTSLRETEREWMQKHMVRSHSEPRVLHVGGGRFRGTKPHTAAKI